MNKKINVLLYIVLSMFVVAAVLLSLLRLYGKYQFEAQCRSTGVFEDATPEYKQKIVSYYAKELKLEFPDSAELLYANADKGILLEATPALSMKLKINEQHLAPFEKQILEKENKEYTFRKRAFNYDISSNGPQSIWNPRKLKNVKKYEWDYNSGCGCVMWLGREGNTAVIYLIYGV